VSGSRSSAGVDRGELGFEESVRSAFGFLASYGFAPVAADEFSAHYASNCARLAVRHGRLSYELSLELGRADQPEELSHPYSMQDLIRVSDPDLARRYRDFAATSRDAIARGLQQLAENLLKFGDGALRCDAEFFAALARERSREIERFGRETQQAGQDAIARAAFDRRDWRRVIEVYEGRTDPLTRAERKRLEIARRHALSG
jgi:hypothetical protein